MSHVETCGTAVAEIQKSPEGGCNRQPRTPALDPDPVSETNVERRSGVSRLRRAMFSELGVIFSCHQLMRLPRASRAFSVRTYFSHNYLHSSW